MVANFKPRSRIPSGAYYAHIGYTSSFSVAEFSLLMDFSLFSFDLQDGRFSSPGLPEDYVYEELLTRTSWCNADYASKQVDRVYSYVCLLLDYIKWSITVLRQSQLRVWFYLPYKFDTHCNLHPFLME